MYKLADISIWYRKNGELELETVKSYSVPCQSSPRKLDPLNKFDIEHKKRAHAYLVDLSTKETLYATTITIGNKYVGCLSYHDQYEKFIKVMKMNRKKNDTIKCIYHFELNSNGQLHAHGIETGGYAQNFKDAFGVFGKHNLHKDSYKKITNIRSYLKYIDKENIKPWFTNLHKDILNTNVFLEKENKKQLQILP